MTSGGFLTACVVAIARRWQCQELARAAKRALFLLGFAVALPFAAPAAPRTFVASTGNDANAATGCQVTAPCQSFAAAYGVTNVAGQIIALDTAGYGSVTITNTVSIIAIARAYVKVNASTTGITINGGDVLLSNIEITGLGNATTTGIALNGGHLILKNSALTHLTTGLQITNAIADIINTDILFNTTAIATSGAGQDQFQNWGFGVTTEARLYYTTVMGNGTAFNMVDPGASIQTAVSRTTILLYNGGTQDNALIGNTTRFTGSGTGCPSGSQTNRCDHALTFTSPVSNSDGAP